MIKPNATVIEVGAILAAPGRLPAAGPALIRIKAGRIAAIEPLAGPGTGTIAIAAPVNAHDHGRGLRTLAFGAVDDGLEAWIPTLGREPRLSAYHRAVVAFARMAEGGIAATNHSHGPQDEGKILEEAAAVSKAARDVGIHVAFATPFTDRNPLVYGDQQTFLAAADAPLRGRLQARLDQPKSVQDYLRSVEAMAALEHESFRIQYCPVGAQWVSDASLAAIAEASAGNGRRIHMHLLETRYQREWADHEYPDGIVRRLDEIGLLSPRLSVAHGVYLREEECALMAERGVIVSVNTSSNFRLRSGIAPVADFVKTGLGFGIGLDAQPLDDDDDILREMRLVWLNHRGFGLDDVLTAERLFHAATIDGRRAVIGEDGGGHIEVGAPADLMLLDYAAMTPDVLSATQDPTIVLLTRATRKHIRRLIVAGRTIVEDGRCVTVDRPALEAELIAEAKAAGAASPPDDAVTANMKRAVRRYYGCGCHFGGQLVEA
ncbi:amidohydrolase family protein [Kaistia dalseonensis]|uniref:Cytosine/adenosine deaminase-related metal-dependent hydrolase n=1 Tax=Kaistia dalseonensis TaxID=410840 RepID=A0ABU0H8V5_9HYPH|nr:amidohydrolase family protein [Kaistia dalseonensis]MCX5496145.1 amidohydrolase family protein [Kaistia dalseonensis]MDQ0438754.1 cytosine/adenosine deaminase-related metal-dependent hydrolase [Kaistia dalseonensis]